MTPTDEVLTNQEIIEVYFKALGWKAYTHPMAGFGYLKDKEGNRHKTLPNILESFPDFKEHVLGVMEGEGWEFIIEDGVFFWVRLLPESKCEHNPRHTEDISEETKDNNILHAAAIAATRYLEEKKDDK